MFGEGYFHRDFIETISKQHGGAVNFSFEIDFATTALLDLVTEFKAGIVSISFDEPVHLDLTLARRKDGYLSKAFNQHVLFFPSSTSTVLYSRIAMISLPSIKFLQVLLERRVPAT